MRLINCESTEIVQADLSIRWVALSHRWGATMGAAAHDIAQASATFKDAMSVTAC